MTLQVVNLSPEIWLNASACVVKLEKCEIFKLACIPLPKHFDLVSRCSFQRRQRIHGEFAAGMLSDFAAQHNLEVFGAECAKPAVGAGAYE